MSLICSSCGIKTEHNYGPNTSEVLCKFCAGPNSKQHGEKDVEVTTETKLTNEALIDWLQLFGWFYFVISIVGGIILIVSATTETKIKSDSLFYSYEVIKNTNPIMIGMGITTLIQGLVILLILLALAKILKQNNYLIRKMKN